MARIIWISGRDDYGWLYDAEGHVRKIEQCGEKKLNSDLRHGPTQRALKGQSWMATLPGALEQSYRPAAAFPLRASLVRSHTARTPDNRCNLSEAKMAKRKKSDVAFDEIAGLVAQAKFSDEVAASDSEDAAISNRVSPVLSRPLAQCAFCGAVARNQFGAYEQVTKIAPRQLMT